MRQVGLTGTELAKAQCGTIWAQLLKVAAAMRISVRRVWVSLSSVFPCQELFAHCLSRLREVAPGLVVDQRQGMAGRCAGRPGAGVPAQRLLGGRTAQSVPEQVGMQGRDSRMRAFLQARDRDQWRVSSRQPILEAQGAQIQSSARLVTYAG